MAALYGCTLRCQLQMRFTAPRADSETLGNLRPHTAYSTAPVAHEAGALPHEPEPVGFNPGRAAFGARFRSRIPTENSP